MANQSEGTTLRARIESAFADRRHPGADRIAHTRPGCTGYEGNLVTELFGDRDWRDIAFEELLRDYEAPHDAIPAFMTAEGLAYYLPGFLWMALDLEGQDPRGTDHWLFGFADSLCFTLTAPSPHSLDDQYEFVKDMPDVPDDIKEMLRNPTPEARSAERAIVEKHANLVALLSDEQRATVRAVLEHVAPLLDGEGMDAASNEEFNPARLALAKTWNRFG
ncbi:MAG: hypothetical protein GY791_09555 [Alphaproteobacteria bacterium]|nr:hypothetical protein [Alphaproteobacteria bacterium]